MWVRIGKQTGYEFEQQSWPTPRNTTITTDVPNSIDTGKGAYVIVQLGIGFKKL